MRYMNGQWQRDPTFRKWQQRQRPYWLDLVGQGAIVDRCFEPARHFKRWGE
jgi:hypothetical protein